MVTTPVAPVFQNFPTGVDADTTPEQFEALYGITGDDIIGEDIGFGTLHLSPGETATITFDMGFALLSDITDGVTDDGTGINSTGPFVPNDSTAYVNLTGGISLGAGAFDVLPEIGTLSLDTTPPNPSSPNLNEGIFTLTLSHADWIAAGSPEDIVVRFTTEASFPEGFYFLTVTCFAAGTEIATPSGGTTVEELRPGDLVRTLDGRDVPVRWVWRQKLRTAFDPMPDRLSLVRIEVDALGHGLPKRELRVTADHALLVDGILINAGALVNGATIHFEPISRLSDVFEVFHVETEAHELLLAEGVATESFIDYSTRESFDNYAEYRAVYDQETIITEMPLARISTSRLVPPTTKRRLTGHYRHPASPKGVVVGGEGLEPPTSSV